MTSDEQLIFSVFAGMAIFMVVVAAGIWFLTSRIRKRSDARAAEAAAARGLQLHTSTEGSVEVRRWQGTTNGVAWTAEHRISESGRGTRDHDRTQTRWRADSSGGPSAPILVIPERSSLKRLDSVADAVPSGFL